MKTLKALFLLAFLTYATAIGAATLVIEGPLLSNKGDATGGGGHNPPASPIILETFEGTGYSAAGWTEQFTGGTLNKDYTTTVLDGSQSLFIQNADFAAAYVKNTMTAAGHYWAFFKVRPGTLSGTKSMFDLADVGSVPQCSVTLSAAGAVRVQVKNNAAGATTVATMSSGTTYNVWVEFNINNGANCIGTVAFSTGTTRPTSGSNFAQVSTTTSATQVQEVFLGPFTTDFGSHVDYVFDYFILDDAQIGDNP